jgi:branched-chain amino acid transport system ATP-binding protein
VHLGISHVPEGRRVFKELTVFDNLRMGAYSRCMEAILGAAMRRVFTYFPRPKERQKQLAGTLSGGEQQMLSIARALISGPTFLMVDEPSFGLAPLIVEEISHIIGEINRSEDVTILLVEQNVNMAFAISQWTYVMENGEVVLSGASHEVAEDPHVRDAYLGVTQYRVVPLRRRDLPSRRVAVPLAEHRGQPVEDIDPAAPHLLGQFRLGFVGQAELAAGPARI